jgi:CHAT domain-containing protein/Tfp pilus assembly protein PilF
MRISYCILLGLFLLAFCASAYANEEDWEEGYQRASDFLDSGNYTEAFESAEKALKISESFLHPNPLKLVKSINIFAELCLLQGKYAEAKPLCNRAIEISEEKLAPDHPAIAKSLNNFAELCYYHGKYAKAEVLYKRALSINEKALGRKHPQTATTLSNLVQCYIELGNYNKAEQLCKLSLEINKQCFGINHPIYATSLSNLALLYDYQGKYNESELLYKQALEITEKEFGINHQDVVTILNNLAEVCRALGEYAQTELFHKRALKISKKVFGSNHTEYAISLNNLAILYDYQGRYVEAEQFYKHALKVWRGTYGQNHLLVATALNNLAELYKSYGRNDELESLYRQALEITEGILGPDHPECATLLNNLGHLYYSIGNYVKAEQLYKRALTIWKKAWGPEHPDVAIVMQNLANLYCEMQGGYAKAESLYKDVLSIWENSLGPHHPHVAITLNNLAEVCDLQGKDSIAAPLYMRALRITQEKGYIISEQHIQACFGYFLKKQGKIAEALIHFKRSVEILENLRRQFKVEEVQQSFMKDKMGAYKQLVLLLLEQGNIEDAFSFVERAKSRTLLDMLGNHQIKLKDSATQEQLKKERKLQNKINSLRDRTIKEKSKPNDKQRAVLSEWDRELIEAQQQYSEILREIKQQSPELASFVSVDSLNLKDVQELIDPGITILEYFVTYEKTVVFVVSKNLVKAFQVDATEEQLQAKVDALRRSLSMKGYQEDKGGYKVLSSELFELLLKDALNEVPTERICIVPHGVLHYLPFHMLSDGQKSLIDKYEIFYSPSSSVLQFCFEKRKPVKEAVLVFGNPDYEDKLPQLPFAELEAKKIKNLFPKAFVYIGSQATETMSKTRSSGMNIVHFATHAEFNEHVPIFSSIRLARDGNEDGLLEMHEIFGLDLADAGLVTLSGCETAISDISKGDELIGLPRAFIYAGTPSVLASLWRVDDASTAALMIEFYKNLKTMPKSQALRKAQLKIRSQCKDNHPIFWGSFILIGDWK